MPESTENTTTLAPVIQPNYLALDRVRTTLGNARDVCHDPDVIAGLDEAIAQLEEMQRALIVAALTVERRQEQNHLTGLSDLQAATLYQLAVNEQRTMGVIES